MALVLGSSRRSWPHCKTNSSLAGWHDQTSTTKMPQFNPQMARYRAWLRDTRQLDFKSFEAMRQWSVGDIDAFWQSIWDYFDLQSPTPHHQVLAERRMPGAVWFPG